MKEHFAFPESELITWLASYPKSGNTWLRCLLQAYRTDGYLDINDLRTGYADSAECYMRIVSAVPLENLGPRGTWLLRPAALLSAMSIVPAPRMFKTHFANVCGDDLPAFIPSELTQRAVYVVRDPRSVALSFAAWFGISHEEAVASMAREDMNLFSVTVNQTIQFLSTWSKHVNSWMDEKRYPVMTVRYEDLLEQPEEEFAHVVRFLGLEYDGSRVERSVQAAQLSRLRRSESKSGWREYQLLAPGKRFFGKGGTRWHKELAPELVARIESDHGDTMRRLAYLEN